MASRLHSISYGLINLTRLLWLAVCMRPSFEGRPTHKRPPALGPLPAICCKAASHRANHFQVKDMYLDRYLKCSLTFDIVHLLFAGSTILSGGPL
ncbi:COX assembly protein 2 [Fusarium oxysporum f. sp. albedinis]|nr:COX assembly protein 2 [Fusarium oxysporum f. sp. albedinis]